MNMFRNYSWQKIQNGVVPVNHKYVKQREVNPEDH